MRMDELFVMMSHLTKFAELPSPFLVNKGQLQNTCQQFCMNSIIIQSKGSYYFTR